MGGGCPPIAPCRAAALALCCGVSRRMATPVPFPEGRVQQGEGNMVRGLRVTASFAAALMTCAAVALGVASPVVYASSDATSGTAQTYVVLYAAQALPGDAASRVQAAGGSIVAAYPEIGVVIARSTATS